MARSFKQRGTVVVPLAESPIPMVEVESIDNPAIFSETIAGEGNITGLTVYGKSTQDGTPSPENPVPIVSAGDGGSIVLTVSDGAEQSQSLILSTPNGLPGIPVDSGGNYTDADGQQWVCDEIDCKNGAYIKNLTLIPDLSIGTFTKHADGMFICDARAFSAPHGNSKILSRCTHFPSVNTQSFYGILVNSHYVIIGVALAETFDNVDDFNNFLLEQRENNTPVQLLYYQNESIETPLSEDELAAYRALHTYDGTTVISVNSDPIAPGVKTTVKVIDPNSDNPQIMRLWLDKEGHPVNINGRGARVGGTPTQQYILQPCSF